MSLINEALKKAQKLRTGEPIGTIAPMPGGSHQVTKHGEPRSPQQLVLIATGAILLVVLSVVGTFWFVNRPAPPKPTPKPIIAKSVDSSSPSPAIVPPAIKPPAVVDSLATKSAVTPVALEPAAKPAPDVAPLPVTIVPPPAAVSTNPPPEQPVTERVETSSAPPPNDPRVHAFVDAIKVGGIRSSGGDSRVLMNDRVFRVNDIVERNLGVRLTKVAPDSLTFTDSNGAVYVKNF